MAERRPITVRSLFQAAKWLSIAALNWPQHRGPKTHSGYSSKMTS